MAGLGGKLKAFERSGGLRLLIGWGLMVASVSPMVLTHETIVTEQTRPALVLAGIILAFLFLLRPRLGSIYQVRGVVSALLVFITTTIGISFMLANRGEYTIEQLYRSAQTSVLEFLSPTFGETFATMAVHPLYLIIAIILLISFAFKSYKGFLLIVILLLVYGMFPFRPGIFAGYMLWFAGFYLITDETLYLPRRIEERIELTKGMRDLLLAVREGPVHKQHALMLLAGAPVQDESQLPPAQVRQLQELAGTNLLEYDTHSGVFLASETLSKSYTPPGIRLVVEVLSAACSVVVLAGGFLYLAWPVDFFPEALLGPIGLIDDAIIASLSALPAVRIAVSSTGRFSKRRKSLTHYSGDAST